MAMPYDPNEAARASAMGGGLAQALAGQPQQPVAYTGQGVAGAPGQGYGGNGPNMSGPNQTVLPDPNEAARAKAMAGGLSTALAANQPLPPPTSAGQAPQNYMEDLYKQFGSAFMAPTYTGAAMPGIQQQLAGPGQAEQFYTQAQNTATDPYYQRLQTQGMDALNQQMAARGHFNSGGAIAGLGNFQSGLAAQQYHQMGDLANQAQSQGQARAGLNGQLSMGADANDLNRINSMFGAAGQAQGFDQSRRNSMLSQQMGIDATGAGLVGGFYGAGGQLSGSAAAGSLEAQAKALQATASGQQANTQFWASLAKTGLGAYMGGPAGAAGGAGYGGGAPPYDPNAYGPGY